MKSLHKEVREKAVKSVLSGELSHKKAASIFEVHLSTIYAWISVYKHEGRTHAHKCGGRKPTFTNEHEQLLHELIAGQPDITLAELEEKLGYVVKKSCINVHLRSLGYTYKKNSKSKGARARRHQNC